MTIANVTYEANTTNHPPTSKKHFSPRADHEPLSFSLSFPLSQMMALNVPVGSVEARESAFHGAGTQTRIHAGSRAQSTWWSPACHFTSLFGSPLEKRGAPYAPQTHSWQSRNKLRVHTLVVCVRARVRGCIRTGRGLCRSDGQVSASERLQHSPSGDKVHGVRKGGTGKGRLQNKARNYKVCHIIST